MSRPPAGRTRLTVEPLELRETPAAGAWSVQSFDSGTALPLNWQRWPAAAAMQIAAGQGPDLTPALVLPGASAPARGWAQSVFPADYGARATVRSDGPVPVQLLVRGRDLGTPRPSYYGASVGAGGTIQLIRVVHGRTTVLAAVRAAEWTPGQWVEVAIQPAGTRLSVVVRRSDTGQFLTPIGGWQGAATAALAATDATLVGGGQAGVHRPASGAGRVRIDDMTVLAPVLPDKASFHDSAPGSIPGGLVTWAGGDEPGLAVSSGGVTGNGLTTAASSRQAARVWFVPELPGDVTATAAVRVDSLIPAEVFVRGRDLDGPKPTYYGASVARGVEVKLLRMEDGRTTELAVVRSATYLSGIWLDVSVTAQGDRLQARVRRRDTGEWLNRFGRWQAEPAAALDAKDSGIRGPGLAGLGRSFGPPGAVLFDDLMVRPADGDVVPPRAVARIQQLTAGTVGGQARLIAIARDNVGLRRVEFLIDGEPVARLAGPPYRYVFDTRNLTNGPHTLTVRAWDAAGNLGEASRRFVVSNPSPVRPAIPRHYSHIRVAALAYSGNPMGPFEQGLVRESVDLVVPNARFLETVNAASPGTPQLIYSNVSNLYLELLTDWLAFADRHRLSREAGFYHVAGSTPFSGDSPSSQSVTWFWNVATGPLVGTTGFRTRTTQARRSGTAGIQFGEAEAVYIGHPDRFREMNLNVSRAATGGWAGSLEYASAVDANGRPTAWKVVPLAGDSTDRLRRSGRVTFDPPADWRPAVLPGSRARLYYVRVRAAAGMAGDAPVAASILGRDYVGAGGGKSGTIPAFDAAADRDGDGHLTDPEYAARRPGFDARFVHESRLFYPGYGQMRFVTNPAGLGVAGWAVDYFRRMLAISPLADGIFLDNSAGRNPAAGVAVVEPTDTYASDYAAVLGAVGRGIAPQWVLANTSGGGTAADRVARQVPATIEEFALRPMAQTWAQFSDLASTVQRRLALSELPGYLVLDSLSTGGSPTDPRTRMAALASYYLIADPDATMFMAWGGEEPASSWSRHWWEAIGFDIGRPGGSWSELAAAADPANAARTYRVLSREYDRALVLYKPLSYAAGKGTGGTGDDTSTVHQLDRNYRVLNADGSLGPVIRTVALRNGEGAILVKA